MGSATSFFNATLYRKNMTRFWPLWAAYGVAWVFIIPMQMTTRYFNNIRWGIGVDGARARLLQDALDLPEVLSPGAILAACMAALAAMAVFSYLYNNRSACAIHALPVRREALYWSSYLAGLSFLVLPQLAAGALGAAVELALLPADQWKVALTTLGLVLLVQSATALFFFSFAAFCAMFTGHLLALPVFYGVLNVLVLVLNAVLSALLEIFFFGYILNWDSSPLVRYLTPAYALAEACAWERGYDVEAIRTTIDLNSITAIGNLESPGTVAAYAGVGVVLAILALLVYQRRHVETAGDVVAVPLVRPLFRYGVAFCAGLGFGVATAGLFSWREPLPLSLCVVVWSAVGCVAAEMLLCKSFRVLKYWRRTAVAVVAAALLCTALSLDLFGIESRSPSVEETDHLEVSVSMGYPYDDAASFWREITDPEEMARFIDLHRAILQDKDRVNVDSPDYRSGENTIHLRIEYYLKKGGEVLRSYHSIPVYQEERELEGSVTWQMEQLLADRKLVARSYDFDRFEQYRMVEAYITAPMSIEGSRYMDTLYLEGASGEELMELWQAVRADFDQGTIGVRYLFDDNERLSNTCFTDLTFVFEVPREDDYEAKRDSFHGITITLTPNAQNTLACLERMGGLGETWQLRPHTRYESTEVRA